MTVLDRQKGCLYGLAIGDALGASVEFEAPGTFEPVTGYRAGGPWNLNAGEWTDDTSMALALADSLSYGFNQKDQLKSYADWYYRNKYTVNGVCFDTGLTTRKAIDHFENTREILSKYDENMAGNGSIMRLAPIAIKYHNDINLIDYAAKSSETTHSHPSCISACAYLASVLAGLINSQIKEESLFQKWNSIPAYLDRLEIKNIFMDEIYKIADNIKGSGYVVKSLEAALWAFWSSESFEETVLKAVNLGDDADTTGAVAGQLAGAYYGYTGIPQHLIDGLAKKEMIEEYFNKLVNSITYVPQYNPNLYGNIGA